MFSWLVVSILLGFRANLIISAPQECEGSDCALRTCEPVVSTSLMAVCFSPSGRRLACDERMLPGSRVSLTCKEGYWLRDDPGYSHVTCKADGLWDKCPFACQRVCGYRNPIENNGVGQHPWYATVFRALGPSETPMAKCGATIISDNMIVTAAHCVYNDTLNAKMDASLIGVAIGNGIIDWKNASIPNAQYYNIKEIIVHPQYAGSTQNFRDDIAILITAQSIKFNEYIAPVCLDYEFSGPITELPKGSQLAFAYYDGPDLLSGYVNMHPITECRGIESLDIVPYLLDNKLCSGNLQTKGRAGMAQYYGTGVLSQMKTFHDSVMYLRGIVSVLSETHAVVGYTDVLVYLDWMRDVENSATARSGEERLNFCGRIVATNNRFSTKCTLPGLVENGQYSLGSFVTLPPPGHLVPEYSVIKYTCRDGYALTSSNTGVCENGRFPAPPSCLRQCKGLTSESVHLECSYRGETFACDKPVRAGTVARLQCKRGYRLPYKPDLDNITCGEDGTWDYSLYKCDAECGLARPRGTPYVIKGKDADFIDFPWHIGIFRKNEAEDYSIWCGGSIISSKMIVSAAHCFYQPDALVLMDKSQFGVGAGKLYSSWKATSLDSEAQYRNVKNIIAHQAYLGQPGNYAADIALVELDEHLEFSSIVRPVCVDWSLIGREKIFEAGTEGIVSGWGLTLEDGQVSTRLQYTVLPTVSRETCLEDIPRDFRGLVTPDKFCAGYLNGTSLCKGDSGGGLAFPRDNGDRHIYYLHGIVSVGPVKDGSCDSHQYTVFTSVLSHLSWLRYNRI